jgi:hypothetical protein
MRRPTLSACLVAAAIGFAAGAVHAATVLLDSLSGRQVFPVTNWWNVDISSAPLATQSAAMINWISGRTGGNTTATRAMHPDFGPPPYGIPYVVVDGTLPRVPVTFVEYGNQSDSGYGGLSGYPIPVEARTQPNYIEGATAGGGTSGDRHMLLIDRDRWLLYETYATRWNASQSRWEAGSGAIFNLNANDRRTEGWTSADASGMAIFPGLVRYDEVYGSNEITHAFRVTTRSTNGYVWPASHTAGSTAGAPPMGTRLRMKAGRDISSYPAQMQKIFRAMKKYGLIVVDNGSDMYVTGTMDGRWNNGVLNPAFHSLTADDFEVIELGWGLLDLPDPPDPPRHVRIID